MCRPAPFRASSVILCSPATLRVHHHNCLPTRAISCEPRHCERSEAIHFAETSLIVDCHVASLLAMTHLQTLCEALRHCVHPTTLRAHPSHSLSENFFCIFFTESLKMNSENGILLSIYIIEDFAHRIVAYNNLSSWIFVGTVRVAELKNFAVSIQKCDFINFCTP